MKASSILIILIIILSSVFALLYSKKHPPIYSDDYQVVKPEIYVPEQEGLPLMVEAKRQAIYKAAKNRSYENLASLANQKFFSYSFGGPYEGGFAEFMKLSSKDEGKTPFDIIPKILELPYAKNTDIYVWPGFFIKSPEDWTESDLIEMRKIMTEEDIENYRKFGGYLGYRVGIKEDGSWIYYIAGD